MDGEAIRFIREEVRKQVNIILNGQAGNNDQFSEDINNLYPGCPTIPLRPVMHPYGFGSRAPTGTLQITARNGEHPGNRLILGHRDANRPTLNAGETILYNQFGQQIYLEDGKIHIGSKAAANPISLGDIVKKAMSDWLTEDIKQTHLGNLGFLTGPPTNAAKYAAIKASPVDDDAMNSDTNFTEK